jgi:hypothetical protein
MEWARYVAHRISVGKREGKRPLERLRRRREKNIEISTEEMGWMDMDCISIAQNGQVMEICRAVMNFRFPYKFGNHLTR